LISNNLENEFYNLEMITNIFYRYNLIKFDHKLATYHQIYLENIKKSNYPKPTPKPDKQFLPKTLWSTDIEKLLKNPYEFYAKKILKLREKEPLFDLFDRRNFGIIIHQLLEKLAEKCKIKLISSQSQLTAFIYKFARQNLSTAYYHGWIERLLNLRPLFQELFVEANGTIDNEYIIKTTLNHIEIAAKIDYCLTNDRQISFIDYKTGALPTKNNIIMGFNCQLTIAALIALDNQITPEKISYLKLIGGDKLFQEIEINNPLLTELITNCRQGLNDIIELFYRQQAAFIAVPKNLHNHNYNQYDHLARTLEIFTD
jgi:ATP-dependent helicase/nuclease subunit B